MNKKFLKKLPQIHQNDVQKKFFDATFEQLFSKKQSKKFDGYIGRRVSGVFDLEKDYYLPEIDKQRTWYQLEPVSFTRDLLTGEKQNVNFYTDIVNRLKYYGGNVGNHDRLFSGEYYTYAPPIDVDKFVNYQNYIWVPIRLLPIQISGFDDTMVESLIIGRDSFSTTIDSEELNFISGIRVTFPDSTRYRGQLTVEGVGSSIRLVEDKQEVLSARRYQPLPWDDDATISGLSLDNRNWDNNMWDAIDIGALLRDYITIERGARDSNMWSRTNKWIHRSALETTIRFSKQSFPAFSVRAERPIIEFKRDIELFNFGNLHRADVDAVTGSPEISHNLSDLTMQSATGMSFLQIRQYPEFALLSSGSLVVFMSDETVDSRTGRPVNSTVYRVSFDQSQTVSFLPTDIYLGEGENILVKGGNTRSLDGNLGYYFHISNGVWTQSNNFKRSSNQAPMFNAYDSDAYPLNDDLRYVNSSFRGTPIFGYSVDRSLGARNDLELGFPIRYRSSRQGSEIIFENFLETTSYTFIGPVGVETFTGYQYFRNVDGDDQLLDRSRWSFDNGWQLGKNASRQHVVYKYPVSIDGLYRIDVSPLDGRLDNISAISDGKEVTEDSVSIIEKNGELFVRIDGLTYGKGYDVELRVYTHDVLPDNSNGFFEIPSQLEANPTQFEVSEISYGELVPHFNTIISNQPEYTGRVSRDNNYLNSSKDLSLGTRIIQSKTSMLKSMLVTSNETIDLVDALRFSSRSYTSFKQQFIRNLENSLDHYPIMGAYPDVKKWVDSAIIASTDQWVDTGAFANSNMYPIGDPTAVYEAEVVDISESVSLSDVVSGIEYRITEFDVATVTKKFYQVSVNDGTTVMVSGQDYFVSKENGFLILKFNSDHVNVNVILTSREVDVVLPFTVSDHNKTVYCYSTDIVNGRRITKKLLTHSVDYSYYEDGLTSRIVLHDVQYDYILVNAFENFVSANIPATPALLGITKIFKPTFLVDYTGNTPRLVLVGHDGSRITMYTDPSKITKAVGDLFVVDVNGVPVPVGMNGSDILNTHASTLARFFDIRDIGLYFYEVTVFNNASGVLKYDYDSVLDYQVLINTAYRNSRYSTMEMAKILTPSLSRWAALYRLDPSINMGAKNYSKNRLRVWDGTDWVEDSDSFMPGSERAILMYYFGSKTPVETPWEMLGFSIKPLWWDNTDDTGDGFTGYAMSSFHSILQDVEMGIIRRGNRSGVDTRVKKPGISNLDISLNDIETIFNLSYDYSDWQIGDVGAVENAWTETSEYCFTQAEIMFLLQPALFGEIFWDTEAVLIKGDQLVNRYTGKRRYPSDYTVHGEVSDENVFTYRIGYQQYLSDYLNFNKRDVTRSLGEAFRTLDVNLGYKVGGFTSKQGIRAYLESSTQLTSSGGLLIPSSNYQVLMHRGAPIDVNFYSGVIVRKIDSGYQVYGYDLLDPSFRIIPADINSTSQRITEGGTAVSFVEFEFNRIYPANTIVRYNGVFYMARTEVNSVSFNKTQWERLPSLPTSGGVTAVYYADRSGDIQEIPYGHIFTDVQSLFDFMIGLSAYQKHRGWTFDRVTDGETNDTWLNSARQMLFWLTVPRKNGESLLLSPLAERAKLVLNHGYPENIERLVNGVYGIVDKYGFSIPVEDTLVSRNDLETTIDVEKSGMFGIRVVVSETEHIILFDQTSEFNDVIYTPVYNTRQGRLRISMTKTQGWFGKMEAPGYIINGNRILENVENLTDRFISLYSDVTDVDNSALSEAARNLIGYDRKDYLDRLSVTDDVQFNFYQGFVRQKGTANALTKILRSNKITDKNRLDVFEEWMVNLSEYGGNLDRVSIEVLSKFDAIETDNPVYRLNYSMSDRLYISEVIVYNAQELYTVVPELNVIGELHHGGRPAVVKAVLGIDRKISRVVVIDSGEGYVSQPRISVAGRPNGADVFLVATKRSVLVEDSKFDTIVDIDANDDSKWLYGDIDSVKNGLPMMDYDEVLPTAGPVSDNESDIKIFNDIYEIENYSLNQGTLVHIAKDVSNDWDIAKLVTTPVVTEMIQGDLKFINGAVVMTPEQFVDSLNIPNDISSFTNALVDITTGIVKGVDLVIGGKVVKYREGKLYDRNDKIIKTIVSGLSVMVLRSMRFTDMTAAQASDYTSTGDYVYLQESGRWEVRVIGLDKVIRSSSDMVLNTNMVTHTNIRYGSQFTYDIPVYDPVKGVIPNVISSDIDIMSEVDPAKYTNGSINLVDSDSAYADREVGMVWLDLGSLRFKMYEISNVSKDFSSIEDLEYRRKNWARVFPGSSVDVYEWVESTVPPRQWDGGGKPKNTEEFTVRKIYNSYIDEIEVKYYFWVKDLSSVQKNNRNRTKSVIEISNLIKNPTSYQLRFASPIKQDTGSLSYVVHGMTSVLRRYNAIVTFGHKISDTAQVVHSDWKILSNSRFNTLPSTLWEKMVDSLVGYTRGVDVEFSGDFIPNDGKKILPVPSKALSEFMKTGLSIRPMQSMFTNIDNARINIFQAINETLTKIKIWEERFSDAYAALYHIAGWRTQDWFAPGFNELNTRALIQVETRFQMEQLTNVEIGNLVRVYPFDPVFGVDLYEVYIRTVEGFSLVRRQDGIIQLDTKYLLNRSSAKVNLEIREILSILYRLVYPSENLGLITEVFFSALNYCATENADLHWAIKTSYISIVQEDRELKQLRFLQPDRLDEYLRYVDDAKPYHTKIRDVAIAYSTSDLVNVTPDDKHFIDIKILFSDFRRDQSVVYSDDMPDNFMLKSVDPSGIRIGTDGCGDHHGDIISNNNPMYTKVIKATRTSIELENVVSWDDIVSRVIDGKYVTGILGKLHNYSGLPIRESELNFVNSDLFVSDNRSILDENGNHLSIGGKPLYVTLSNRVVDVSGNDIELNGRKLSFVMNTGIIDSNGSIGGELVKIKTGNTVTLVQEYSDAVCHTLVEVWDNAAAPWDYTTTQYRVEDSNTVLTNADTPTGFNELGWSSDSHIVYGELPIGANIWVSNLTYTSSGTGSFWTTPELLTEDTVVGVQYGWDGLSEAFTNNGMITQIRSVFSGQYIPKSRTDDNINCSEPTYVYERGFSTVNSGIDGMVNYVTQAYVRVLNVAEYQIVVDESSLNSVIDLSNKTMIVSGEILLIGNRVSEGLYNIEERSQKSSGMLLTDQEQIGYIVAVETDVPTYIVYERSCSDCPTDHLLSSDKIGIIRHTYINNMYKIVPYH